MRLEPALGADHGLGHPAMKRQAPEGASTTPSTAKRAKTQQADNSDQLSADITKNKASTSQVMDIDTLLQVL